MTTPIRLATLCASLWLMLNLPAETWLRFAVWMAIGFAVYFLYGRSHSRLGRREATPAGGAGKPPSGTQG